MATTKDFIDVLTAAIAKLPRFLGNETVRFFQEQMEKEKDVHGRDYEKRGYETDLQQGKSILSGRGLLFDSIEILKIEQSRVTVGVDDNIIAYASIHNEGGNITVTAKMKGFFWHKHQVADDRDLEDDADFYKAMALKKLGSQIEIPQREYVGESKLLQQYLEKKVQAFLNDELSVL